MQTILSPAEVTVIQPVGHLNASNAPEFQGQLTTAIAAQDSQNFLVDMSQVESLDSAGLMSLVSALSLAQRLNRRFSLCSVSASIRIIFELTQLDRVFEIFDNHDAFQTAIAA